MSRRELPSITFGVRLLVLALLAVSTCTVFTQPASAIGPCNGFPVTGVTVTAIESGTVKVDWTNPVDCAPLGFVVTPWIGATDLPALQESVPAGLSTAIVDDLDNGQTYTFVVRAAYAIGGAEDTRSDEITAAGAPGAPTITSATPGDGEIVVEWSEAAANGSAISAYTISVAAGTSDDITTSGSATTGTIADLNNGTAYTVVVTATNAMGSTDSSGFGPVTPCTEIGPPTDLLATAGDGQVFLSWAAPVNEGCGSVSTFKVFVDGTLETTVSVPDTTATVTGLTNGTAYDFAISAVNDAEEESDRSSVESATPVAGDDGGGGGGGGGGAFPSGRVGGTDRFDTASSLSAANFSPGVPVVYLSSGRGFADALSGGPAADRGAGPILLVEQNRIPVSTATELTRLRPGRIVILGGTAVISTAVEQAADAYTAGTVTRLGGNDRYETSAQLSAATFDPGVGVAYLATGGGFADALAAGPAAGGQGPVLLVTKDSIPAAVANELTRLRPLSIVVLGGTAVISTAVEQAADAYTAGSVTRIGGADRFETAVLISSQKFAPDVPTVYLATGSDYADALAAAPLGSPILLVTRDCIPRSTYSELVRLSASRIIVLGGPNAVSDRVRRLNTCI